MPRALLFPNRQNKRQMPTPSRNVRSGSPLLLDRHGVAINNAGHGVRRVATALLALMAAIFVVARLNEDVHPAIGFVRAFAEAAMVGGMADWFAVTALFRHPLGIPIPHTAIVPNNKDRIGDTLAAFLKQNFLIPRLIARRMWSVDVAGAIGRFLAQPAGGGGRLRLGASRMIADALSALDQERLGGMVKSAMADRIRELDLGPLLGQALTAAVADGRHQPLIDGLVIWSAGALEDNEQLIHQMVHDNSGALVRMTGIDEAIANRIVAGLAKLIGEMAEQGDHPFRLKAEEGLAKLAHDLQHDADMQDRVNRIRDEILDNEAVKRWLDGLWEQGRGALLRAARNPDSLLAGRLGEMLEQLGQMLGEDVRLKAMINRFTRRAVVGAIDSYGDTALRLVSDTVRSWDAQTITDRLENTVGADLQFIRINGTVVGGLVGLAIHSVSVLL
jgi:uncharacterized membrane-anchored protein YjiN (DUF445 family)